MDDCLKSDILATIDSCKGRLWHINHDYMWGRTEKEICRIARLEMIKIAALQKLLSDKAYLEILTEECDQYVIELRRAHL